MKSCLVLEILLFSILVPFINGLCEVEMRVVYEPGQSAFCPSETVTAECSSSTACSTLQIESGALGGEIASISTAESVNFSLLKGGCFIILTHKTTEGVTVSIECVPTTKSINFTCGDALNRSVSSTVTAIAATLPGPPVDGKQLVEFFIGSVPVILFTWRYPTQFGGVKIDRSMVAHTSRVQYRGLEIEGDDNCYFVLKDVEPGIEYELTISVGNCVGESPGLLIVGSFDLMHCNVSNLISLGVTDEGNATVCSEGETPLFINGGTVCYTGTVPGSTAVYHCDTSKGYTLCGDTSLTCEDDGKWSSTASTCIESAAKSRLRTGEIAGGDNRVTVGVIVVGLTTITLIICLAKLSKNTGKEPHKRQDRDDRRMTLQEIHGDVTLHNAIKERKGKDEIGTIINNKRELLTEVNENGEIPLHLACKFNMQDAVEVLLKHSIENQLKAKNKIYGNTPLHVAALLGHHEIVCKILEVKTAKTFYE